MVNPEPYALAVLTSDWHLRDEPPPCRRGEPDWYAAMRRPLSRIAEIANSHGVPVLHAGDLLHRWHGSPDPKKVGRLLNFARMELAKFQTGMALIPGQHDMPNHNMASMGDSLYPLLTYDYTCCHEPHWGELGAFREGFAVLFLPYGASMMDVPSHNRRMPRRVLLHHALVWEGGKPKDAKGMTAEEAVAAFPGFDVLVFGDNHHGFHRSVNGVEVVCPGSITRNDTSQAAYVPRCYLLMSDGSVVEKPLPCDEDVFEFKDEGSPASGGLRPLMAKMREMAGNGGGFRETVEAMLPHMTDDARKLALEIMDKEGV